MDAAGCDLDEWATDGCLPWVVRLFRIRLCLKTLDAPDGLGSRRLLMREGHLPWLAASGIRLWCHMDKNPVLELPLGDVMRSEIALSLQVIRIHTVGALLAAWGNPKYQRNIEQVFDSPEQARHAMATFACWLGVQTSALANPVEAWWAGDGPPTQAFAPTMES